MLVTEGRTIARQTTASAFTECSRETEAGGQRVRSQPELHGEEGREGRVEGERDKDSERDWERERENSLRQRGGNTTLNRISGFAYLFCFV